MSLVLTLVVGIIAGWLASFVVGGRALGALAALAVGMLGALLASWLFPIIGVRLGGGFVGQVVSAAAGAIILLALFRAVRRA
jgi:uncharacterized membrane protein YeaQ/YmgE (transglycosylase-associated protein family)